MSHIEPSNWLATFYLLLVMYDSLQFAHLVVKIGGFHCQVLRLEKLKSTRIQAIKIMV
jgi:hypothetical protein